MAKQEVFLPDERVLPIQARLTEEHRSFVDWNTDFVTVRHEAAPGQEYYGVLPEGPEGFSQKPIIQFLIVSDYPATRPIQRAQGVRHATSAIVYEDAWEVAEEEYRNGHYVKHDKTDPLEVIFRGMAKKHVWEVYQLSRIMN
jgi:hypothetical protein